MADAGNGQKPHQLVETKGPWPFTTRRTFRLSDSSLAVWRSRHHRKGLHRVELSGLNDLGERFLRAFWMPQDLNWWIGVIFAIGAALFMVGSVLTLAPVVAQELSLKANTVNAIFFLGSIPFTTAAYLQLYQSANVQEYVPSAPPPVQRRIAVIGWFPNSIGWISCAFQFLGTLLFNINTLDAMIPGLNWVQQDLLIWIPNLSGSILFLVSGYLAFGETCHSHFAWKPASLSWWITFVNLLGCVAFMISAIFAFVPAEAFPFDALSISVTFTLIGAAGFFIGSILMLPETAKSEGD